MEVRGKEREGVRGRLRGVEGGSGTGAGEGERGGRGGVRTGEHESVDLGGCAVLVRVVEEVSDTRVGVDGHAALGQVLHNRVVQEALGRALHHAQDRGLETERGRGGLVGWAGGGESGRGMDRQCRGKLAGSEKAM